MISVGVPQTYKTLHLLSSIHNALFSFSGIGGCRLPVSLYRNVNDSGQSFSGDLEAKSQV